MNNVVDNFISDLLDDIYGQDRQEPLTNDSFWLEDDSILSDETTKVYDKDYYN